MSIQSVRNEIKLAMTITDCSGPNISNAEMKKIAKSAEADGTISAGEARQIDKLVKDGVVKQPSSGGLAMTMACPEHGGSSFTIDKAAVRTAESLFVRNALPYGKNGDAIREKIQASMDESYGKQLSKAPTTRGMHQLLIEDQRPFDGPLLEAFVDPKKDQVFIKATPSGFGGNTTPVWYRSSVKLKGDESGVTEKTVNKLRAAFAQAAKAGLEYGEPNAGAPLGVKYVRVPLMQEKHPDGYSYTALIPVGTVYPGAKVSDPNKVSQFFVERSGGFAGFTQLSEAIHV